MVGQTFFSSFFSFFFFLVLSFTAKRVQVRMAWDLKVKDRVEYELWTSCEDSNGAEFKRDFMETALKLINVNGQKNFFIFFFFFGWWWLVVGLVHSPVALLFFFSFLFFFISKVADFTPRFYIYDGHALQCDSKYTCGTQCTCNLHFSLLQLPLSLRHSFFFLNLLLLYLFFFLFFFSLGRYKEWFVLWS